MLPSATGPPKSGPPRNDLRGKVGNSRTCWRQTYVDYRENLDIERNHHRRITITAIIVLMTIMSIHMVILWPTRDARTNAWSTTPCTTSALVTRSRPGRFFYFGWCYVLFVQIGHLDLDLGVADSEGDWPPRPRAGLRFAWDLSWNNPAMLIVFKMIPYHHKIMEIKIFYHQQWLLQKNWCWPIASSPQFSFCPPSSADLATSPDLPFCIP